MAEIPIEDIVPFVAGPFVVLPDGRIDCTWLDPRLGPVPFTADPEDPEPHGRAVHAYALTQL